MSYAVETVGGVHATRTRPSMPAREAFDAESVHSTELQRQDWQPLNSIAGCNMKGFSMKRIGFAMLFAVVAYVAAAVAGYFLVGLFSGNTHDRSVESAMTSAFVFGPLGAVVGFVVGFIRSGRSADQTQEGARGL